MENDEKVTPQADETLDQPEEELELEEGEEKSKPPQGSDPLDSLLEDPQSLLAEAKKFRAIVQRSKKVREEPKKVEPKPVYEKQSPQDFLKKSDFEKANEKKAIRLSTTSFETDSEDIKKEKSEMLENWDQIKSFYVSRRGKDTPEDIMEDIRDAYILFSARKTSKPVKPDVTDLTTTKVVKGTASHPESKSPKKELPNFKKFSQPKDWYKKPE